MEKNTKQNLEELAQMSGEKNVKKPSRYTVPIVRLDGKSGTFKKVIQDSNGKSETIDLEEESITGTVLKIRRVLSKFKDDSRLFSNEHNTWKDNITLFEAKFGSRSQVIDSGPSSEVRERHQELRVNQNIYFLLNGEEIVKLIVKGSSLSNLFDYFKEFKGNEHVFEFETVIGSEAIKGKLGSYYTMTFEKGNKSDIKIVGEKIREVNDAIVAQDNFYESNAKPIIETTNDISVDEEVPISSFDIDELPGELPSTDDEF